MVTQLRCVRKLERRWGSDPGVLVSKNTYANAGYYLISDDTIPLMNASRTCEVFKWCDDNFTHDHWIYTCDNWIFTYKEDAIQFKLTWV